MYDARQIANWFIDRSAQDGRTPSIMSLLKLVYIAHGWRLEMTGQPLVNNKIEAWQYGPVIPEVYHSFRPQGITPRAKVAGFTPPNDQNDIGFLEQIYTIYGGMSPFHLSDLTHEAGGPWETAQNWGGWYAEIPDELIKSHYISKRQKANQAGA